MHYSTGGAVTVPSYEDLVTLLAGVHVTDHKRTRAYDVAGHLVAYVLKERWHGLSERQRRILIKASGDRLWNGYMAKRRIEDMRPKEAAQDAIFDEIAALEQELNPNNTKPGLLGQLDDL
jgi:hypothetical protein